MSQTKLFLIVGIVLVVVIGLLMFVVLGNIGGFGTGGSGRVTLQFWGVFEDGQSFKPAIDAYKTLNPNVSIVYKDIPFEDYEQTLINAFAAGTGPDIWMMHNTWLPKHGDKIAPIPQSLSGGQDPLFTFRKFQDQFVDVAVDDLTLNGTIAAIPIYVDTLALYYNKDLFNSAGLARPPENWEDFNEAVGKLTLRGDSGDIIRAGAVMGTARNINRSTDILMLLMLQSGVQMTSPGNTSATFAQSVNGQNIGQLALQYYTDFANPAKRVYTWNEAQHYSIDAFINGNAAMMFNYSHHIATIRDKAVRFNFGVAPMPQIAESPVKINFANYWAPTVSKASPAVEEAWKFLVYLGSQEGASAYLSQTERPPARRDLIERQKNLPDIGVFAQQALSARSWYQVDNKAIETIFADMVEDVNFGRTTIREALSTAESRVNVLMRRARE